MPTRKVHSFSVGFSRKKVWRNGNFDIERYLNTENLKLTVLFSLYENNPVLLNGHAQILFFKTRAEGSSLSKEGNLTLGGVDLITATRLDIRFES